MVDHSATPTDSAVRAKTDSRCGGSWIDRVVVLSVCDAVDMQRSTVDGSDT
jgi:hypothetical protein